MADGFTAKNARKKKAGNLGETVRTVGYAVAIALVVRTFLFEPFNIPSGSMIPSLLIGDYLFVSKYTYGYSRHSFPMSMGPFSGRLFENAPQRGDVAVFKLPTDARIDYIKRVIGLPGDTVQVAGGVLYINGKPVERQRIDDYVARDERGNITRLAQYVETLPEGRKHRIVEVTDQGRLDDTEPYKVPTGHYFMMGDNRDNSLDSRVLSHVGYVPAENLVGRAEILFFSSDSSASWWQPWKWFKAVRFSRFFSGVE